MDLPITNHILTDEHIIYKHDLNQHKYNNNQDNNDIDINNVHRALMALCRSHGPPQGCGGLVGSNTVTGGKHLG